MGMISGGPGTLRWANRRVRLGRSARLAVALAALMTPALAAGAEPARFPTVPAGHTHVRALLENALRYLAPENKIVDPVSGYPFEGWNQDPPAGVFLRSFTQLTAIGQTMELLANVVAGQADSPALSREQALAQLTHLVASLRQDQRDPTLGARGLLVNFLDLATGKRLGPLASDVQKPAILGAFGPERGEAIWKALLAKGWIVSRNKDREASIVRGATYGANHFDGPLGPFADPATRAKVMEILDQRVVMVVFGDNANLSTSVAKTIGALLAPEIASKPEAASLRHELEQFLDAQREGYARLYDAKAGLFYFGWDATKDRLFGWEDLQGNWTTGHMDYFVNEFRGPAIFVAARFGLPWDAIKNLGFKMKPYRFRDGSVAHVLTPWEGSAFQALGLSLSLRELDSPSWRGLLERFVDVEIDYAGRKGLPGFLSESYTGEGSRYTGDVGIPEVTVSPRPRITDAASLYTLGVAYAIAPEKVERFLAASWPLVSTLLTDHGPWEGYNVARREPIRFQTSAHTLSLILGLLGTGPAHMARYVEQQGIGSRLDEFFRPGEGADLLSEDTQVFAWSDKEGGVRGAREGQAFRVRGDGVHRIGIAFVPARKEGVDVSGTVLSLRYRCAGAMEPVAVQLKTAADPAVSAGLIPKEILTRFADTGGREEQLLVTLPATVGLTQLKEAVIAHERGGETRPVDLTITRLEFLPVVGEPSASRGAR